MGFKVGCPRIGEIQGNEEGRQWVNFSTASNPVLSRDSAPLITLISKYLSSCGWAQTVKIVFFLSIYISNTLMFSLSPVPTQPRAVLATTTADSTVSRLRISWQAPNSANGIILNYEIEYTQTSTGTNSTVPVNGNTFTRTIPVTARQLYSVRVRASTRIGAGPFSLSASVTAGALGKFSQI